MNLLFDLDGTLTDSEVGITRCIVHAVGRLELPAPDHGELRRCIGPPLRDVFAALLATSDPARIDRAVALYLERFDTVGLYENELYPGTAEGLEHLAGSGCRLFLATAKPTLYAQRILEHFGLTAHFTGIHGAGSSATGWHKSELLARVIAEEHISPARSIMIGDRAGEIAGARTNGMRSIGVLWGYGTADELRDADRLVANWPTLIEEVESMHANA